MPPPDPGPVPGEAPGHRPPERHCLRCWRARCVCDCLAWPGVPVRGPVSLLILQHPAEQRAWKNSARLLHLAVDGSVLLVGEAWPAAPPVPDGSPAPTDVLLYPPTPGDAALPEPPALALPLPMPAAPPAHGPGPGPLRLVVLDATWRKSRRMLYASPWLQRLPRLGLSAPPPSRYHVRRARGADQRSTFEAAVLALAMLDPEPARWDALWPVFEGFVARLAGAFPDPARPPHGGR